MTNPEKAAHHAAEAERLLEESDRRGKITKTNILQQLLAIQAGAHATLAVFYAGK